MLRVAGVVAWLAAGVACSGVDGGLGASDDAGAGAGSHQDLASVVGACMVVPRTCADIQAAFAATAHDVELTCDEHAGTFVLRSTGVPTYMSNQSTPNAIADQMWEVSFPLHPECLAAPVKDVAASRGPVGFMVNGIPFYGPEDAQGRDAVVNEGPSFDDCDGHSDNRCSYHYHEEPVCVFGKGSTAAQHALPDGHPPVIGYALDGFALYASQAGAVLDACNGHIDGKRGYHYHATRASPYLLGCHAGRVTGRMGSVPACMNGKPKGDGGTPDGGAGGAHDGGVGPAPCGTSQPCGQGEVCCPKALPCADHCVPDCRLHPACPPMLHCNKATGVCA